MSPTSVPLRLPVSLPGGAALGAYQAGVTAALLVAVQHLRRRGETVTVDALGGASAGSLVALFAARCALDGLDPWRFSIGPGRKSSRSTRCAIGVVRRRYRSTGYAHV